MASKDDIQFHSERAMAELDRALSASSAAAAQAHFSLSALHLQRMQAVGEPVPPLGPIRAH
jgi:hypothetical protein